MNIKFLMENYKKDEYQIKEIKKLNKSGVYIGHTIEGQDDLIVVTYTEIINSYVYNICIIGQLEKGLYLKNPIKVVHIEYASFYDKISANEFKEAQQKITNALNNELITK